VNKIYELRTTMGIARAAGAEVRQVGTRTVWVPIEVAPTVWPVVTNESTILTQPQATPLDKKIVPIQTYGKMIYMANDTLQDAVADPVAWYASWAGRGLALTENAEMLVGDGSANCLGVHVVTTGHTAGVTAASATAVTAAEISALYYSLPAEYRDSVAWTMTGTVEGAIRGLQSDGFNYQVNPAGGGGTAQGVNWLVATNARVFTSASCPAATANLIPIVVGNWSAGYIICESKAMTIFRDPYSRAAYNQVAFHCTARFGGITRDVLAFRGLTMASA
jgi:HK97 family phage major capsid protein